MSRVFKSLLASAALTTAAVSVPAAPALAGPPTTSSSISGQVGVDNLYSNAFAGQHWTSRPGSGNLTTHAWVPAPYPYCSPGENGKIVIGSQQTVTSPTGAQTVGAWIWSDCVNGVETNTLHLNNNWAPIPLPHNTGVGVTIITTGGTSKVQATVGSTTYASWPIPAYAGFIFVNAVWPAAGAVAPLRNFGTVGFDQVTMNGIPFGNFGNITGYDLYSGASVLQAHTGPIAQAIRFKVQFDSV